jgi:hypothetical protein
MNKTLGKKNFYVASISEQFSMDNTNLLAIEHQYKFVITNRKYAITITLDRNPGVFEGNYDYCLQSSTGHRFFINKSDIENMDIFIDKLRYVALG